MSIAEAKQFCAEVQERVTQKEEEKPQEVGRCLTRKDQTRRNETQSLECPLCCFIYVIWTVHNNEHSYTSV